jgi:hypothetical protein
MYSMFGVASHAENDAEHDRVGLPWRDHGL